MVRKKVPSQSALCNYILSHENKIRKEWKEKQGEVGLPVTWKRKGMPLYPRVLRKYQISEEEEQKGGVWHTPF